MNAVIDLGPELLVDESMVRDPYVRLLTAAVGQKLVRGSPWVVIDKRALLPRPRPTNACRTPSRTCQPGEKGPGRDAGKAA